LGAPPFLVDRSVPLPCLPRPVYQMSLQREI
jgi:hypothetical protein